jgi:hypothetical protein
MILPDMSLLHLLSGEAAAVRVPNCDRSLASDLESRRALFLSRISGSNRRLHQTARVH